MTTQSEEWAENIRMLVESAGAVVPEDGSLDRIRAARHQAPGFERDVWSTMGEMGWLAILSNEDVGGLGLGLREAVALCAVLGRGLVPEPAVSALHAIRLTEQAGAVPQDALTGDIVMVAAWQSSPLSLEPSKGVELTDGTLSGTKIAVDGGTGADVFAVTTPQGLVLVPRDAAGLTSTAIPMHDGTICAELHFDRVAATSLPCPDVDNPLYEAMLLHAGYLMGVSEQAFEITLDYLRVRKQFDVPIGSFQALQHRATEIKVQLELARAAIHAAATALDHKAEATVAQMSVLRARTRAGGLARLVAREAVQMHGAIGYTDEADIGLYTRKVMVAAGQYGSDAPLRSQFMALRETVRDQQGACA